MRLVAVAIVLAASSAHADGYFYEQSYGVSSVRGAGAMGVGTGMRVRLGFGVRVGEVALEPWMAADLTLDRTGATYGLGGEPAMGHADLTGVGFDARWDAAIAEHLAIYVRGGPRIGGGTGTFATYNGLGLGAGTGIMLRGRVRALGFVWAPLFWLPRGPKVIGALFLDQGVDWYHFRSGSSAPLDLPIVSTNVGFAIGSDF
ncbi:MAG: hypothetical protein JO257_24395 [Deltaproteobacteria bacterium]|nr:hypothetical protein [Deltaproteobacteria bacterium]